MDLNTRRWSNSQLKKLGVFIRDGSQRPDGIPDYDEVMLWYNDCAETVQRRIRDLDWAALLVGRRIEVTSRAKTIDTLRQKLQRKPDSHLPTIQDVAGVRFEAPMTLEEQDIVVEAIRAMFAPSSQVKDLRDGANSGYRGVHVWLRFPAGRVEVQIRTELQGKWANTYELAADLYGRGIRYGERPDSPDAQEFVAALHSLSHSIAELEQTKMDLVGLNARMASQEERAVSRGQRRTRTAREMRKVRRQIRVSEDALLHAEERMTSTLANIDEHLDRELRERG